MYPRNLWNLRTLPPHTPTHAHNQRCPPTHTTTKSTHARTQGPECCNPGGRRCWAQPRENKHPTPNPWIAERSGQMMSQLQYISTSNYVGRNLLLKRIWQSAKKRVPFHRARLQEPGKYTLGVILQMHATTYKSQRGFNHKCVFFIAGSCVDLVSNLCSAQPCVFSCPGFP